MSEYCRVLIVDDEFIMRQGMKHMLEWEKEGFQIVGEASNGQEGLSLVEELQPHIVLADIVMPVLDGIEFSEIMGRRYPSVQLIILSSYDKFEYVKTTLLNGASDYILKPTINPELLLKTLRKAVDRIPGLELTAKEAIPHARQLEKVLLGFQEKLNEITFVNMFPHTLYRVIAVDLRGVCGKKREDMVNARQIIEDFYREQQDYVSLPAFIKESLLCLVINYRLKDEMQVLIDAEAVTRRLSRLYERMFMVVSRSFSNMQEIKAHYQQDILSEVNNGFYHPDRHLFIVEKCRKKDPVKRFDFEIYTRFLNHGNFAEALAMLESYTWYLCEAQMEEEKLKNLTKNLLYNYLMELDRLSVQSDELKEQYFDVVDHTVRVTDFQKVLGEILEELRRFVFHAAGKEDARIREIRQYVRGHYNEPLDLTELAEHFGFNYNYLSSYFNQMAKEGFSEYLNRIRIEQASKMLKEDSCSISEVGGAVGYSDHSYFCRVFKKITGETPSGYRRREGHTS